MAIQQYVDFAFLSRIIHTIGTSGCDVKWRAAMIVSFVFSTVLASGVQGHIEDSGSQTSKCADLGYGVIYLGDGSVYCHTTTINSCDGFGYCTNMTPVTISIGDNQHILKYTTYGSDAHSETNRTVIRWEEVGNFVVYGEISAVHIEGVKELHYACSRMVPASSLPSNWSLSDLRSVYDFQLPSWCGLPAIDSDRNYTNGSHPFAGEWMIEADSDPYDKIIAQRIVVPYVESLEWTNETVLPDAIIHVHPEDATIDQWFLLVIGGMATFAILISFGFIMTRLRRPD